MGPRGIGLLLIAGCGRFGFDGGPDGGPDADPGEDATDAPTDGLVARGALVRYFLDEASSGQVALVARDALPDPIDLPITFASAGNPAWFEGPTGRGLSFVGASLNGGACAPVGAKVVSALDGTTTGTIEAVAAAQACNINGSRFVHIGFDTGWAFTLGCFDADTVVVEVNDPVGGGAGPTSTWSHDLRGPSVLTFVFESAQPNGADRMRLYANGTLIATKLTDDPPAPSEPLAIAPEQHVCVGNRLIGNRSPQGTISYGAIYAVALSDEEIAANAARLLTRDDR